MGLWVLFFLKLLGIFQVLHNENVIIGGKCCLKSLILSYVCIICQSCKISALHLFPVLPVRKTQAFVLQLDLNNNVIALK